MAGRPADWQPHLAARPRDFAAVAAVGEAMAGFDWPWYVCGGWALDLAAGEVTWPHNDLDVAVRRRDQAALARHLAGWRLEAGVPFGATHPWGGVRLLEPPVAEVFAEREGGAPSRFEAYLVEADGDEWWFGPDASIRLPLEHVGLRSAAGLPVLRPEIVLLHKVFDQPRAVDVWDHRRHAPLLPVDAAGWLDRVLEERGRRPPDPAGA